MHRQCRLLTNCIDFILVFLPVLVFASDITLYYPPSWKHNTSQTKAISTALTRDSGLDIRPRITRSYPDILTAFKQNKPVIIYVGSFVQAVLYERGISTPIAQAITGTEFYTSVLIAPLLKARDDPIAIVEDAGVAMAYTKGASSGASGAKAATNGHAVIGTHNHRAAVNLVKAGKAKAAFVKNWWWEAHKSKYSGMKRLDYPGVSDYRHADYILSVNKAVSSENIAKITQAIQVNGIVFHAVSMESFDPLLLKPTLDLMKKGGIDPKTYAW